MNFYSLAFFLYLPAVLAVYYLTGKKKPEAQPVVLLAASLVFYLWCGKLTFIYVLITSLAVFAGALKLESLSSELKQKRKEAADKESKAALKQVYEKKRNLVLLGVLAVTLGILGYLKYWNVLFEAFRPGHTVLGLVLPLGISYYTFSAIGYLLDVKNGKTAAEKTYWKVLLFMIWFPQLIQGPINRFGAMTEKLFGTHTFDGEGFSRGLLRMLYGFFMKYTIANLLFHSIETIFANVDPGINGAVALLGILLYSAAQYTDFAGGIHMVLGISELFDIPMAENFRQPYFAVSLGDFWRRWHMSLGAWMRDYIFYPLALTKPMQKLGRWANGKFGKHAGRTLPACIANIVVFLCVGLWHGAQAHYLVWGLYNGLVIAVSDLCAPFFGKLNVLLHIDPKSRGMHLFRILRTFIIVNIGWYFDIITDMKDAVICLKNTVFNFHLSTMMQDFRSLEVMHWKQSFVYALPCILVVFVISLLKENGVDVRGRVLKLPFIVRFALVTLMLGMIVFALQYAAGEGGFMYANF